jgi:hypothetical protein
MPASSSRSTGKARSIAAAPLPSRASSWSASSSFPSQPRCRRPTTSLRASSAAPYTRCMTAAMTPSPASCSESSSAPTPPSRSTTAGPSPRYTAARRAERCSSESISLYVVLRCPAQAVAHHPRRERRGWGPDPAATHPSAFSEVIGPVPVHVSEATPAGRYGPFREARRCESAVACQQPSVVSSPQLRDRRGSRPRSRRDCRNRGRPVSTLERVSGCRLAVKRCALGPFGRPLGDGGAGHPLGGSCGARGLIARAGALVSASALRQRSTVGALRPFAVHQSRRMIWIAAALGIASRTPRIPSSCAPTSRLTIVTSGFTWTDRPYTSGCTT